ncbi:WcbI family polysaccharide biosynthesis putative acetyltransferase [Asticcacaulis sp.]|uniref:WcbI family polysaccharide biosynthesis putative acetyltransferase n=1 Tax=Asticcacaulis sp. TaxID=1872648 RepID=UPI002608E327|nr:WcbI family polysaccharide biosynthesis putative acetyltransferase [Asticcacaulis sp.]
MFKLFKKKLKVAIVGGCQAEGLAEATRHLIPHAVVSAWHAGVNPPDSPEAIVAKIKDFDLVLTQIGSGHGMPELEIDRLTGWHPNAHFMPTFVFSGFHPDLSYAFDSTGLINAVHSDFHSKIAVAGFLLGLSPQRTLSLYNGLIFTELGYFDVFPAARNAVESQLREMGFEIDGMIDGWLGQGEPFMYMTNHPAVRVLAALAAQLYSRLGLIPRSAPLPEIEKDHLGESFTWPVYPALAARIGARGSFDFKRPAWLTPAGESRSLTMKQYLIDLFNFYDNVPRERLLVSPFLETVAKIEPLLVSGGSISAS